MQTGRSANGGVATVAAVMTLVMRVEMLTAAEATRVDATDVAVALAETAVSAVGLTSAHGMRPLSAVQGAARTPLLCHTNL